MINRSALVNLLLGITISLLPLYNRVSTFDFARTAKDNLLIFIFSFLILIYRTSLREMSFEMILVVVYGVLSLVVNQWNVASTLVMFQSFYILSGLLFFCHFYKKHDGTTLRYVLNGMGTGCIIQSVFAIPGYWGVNLYPEFASIFSNFDISQFDCKEGVGNVIGTLGNGNLLASYVALSGISFIEGNRKILLIIPAVTLFLNGGVMGIAAFIAGIAYYLNLKYDLVDKWMVYCFSIMLMVMSVFTKMGGHDSGRLEIWKQNIDAVTWKHFFFGMGPGWYGSQNFKYNDVYVGQEHNAFLSFFNVFGVIGLVLLMPIFIKFLKSKDKSPVFASILYAAFVNSFGHFTTSQSTVSIIIIIVLAVCLAEGRNNVEHMERI